MSRYTDSFIEKVRDLTNIVDIISPYTELKRSGSNLMGLCPFPDHREKTASFSVQESKQIYHCFGCKKGGNVFTFLREFQGLSFPQAIEMLANRAGVPLPAPDKPLSEAEERERTEKPIFQKLNKLAGLFYHQQFLSLPEDHPVRLYVKKRGLSDEIVSQFRLGYAPNARMLADYFHHKKAPIEMAERLSLVRTNQSGTYDFFRDRLMFPIITPTGDVIGFGGRILGDGQPKYLNSTESLLFHKSRVFYGLNESAKHIKGEDRAIVVEGYMDFLALFQAGIKNVVAPLGTALTNDHGRVLKRYSPNVTMLFDGDQAGIDAAERSLPRLLSEGLYVKGLFLPNELDPDEFLQEQGVDRLRELLASAKDLFVLVLERKLRDADLSSPSEKVRVLDQMVPLMAVIADPRLKDLYTNLIAERLRVERPWVIKSLAGGGAALQKLHPNQQNVPRGPDGRPMHPDSASSGPDGREGYGQGEYKADGRPVQDLPPVKIKTQGMPKEEVWLINLALMEQEYLEPILQTDLVNCLSSPAARQILERISEVYRHDPARFDTLSSSLASEIEDPSLVTLHLDKKLFGFSKTDGKRLLSDCIRKIRERENKRRATDMAGQLAVQNDVERLKQFKQILEDRMSLQKDSHKDESSQG